MLDDSKLRFHLLVVFSYHTPSDGWSTYTYIVGRSEYYSRTLENTTCDALLVEIKGYPNYKDYQLDHIDFRGNDRKKLTFWEAYEGACLDVKNILLRNWLPYVESEVK